MSALFDRAAQFLGTRMGAHMMKLSVRLALFMALAVTLTPSIGCDYTCSGGKARLQQDHYLIDTGQCDCSLVWWDEHDRVHALVAENCVISD